MRTKSDQLTKIDPINFIKQRPIKIELNLNKNTNETPVPLWERKVKSEMLRKKRNSNINETTVHKSNVTHTHTLKQQISTQKIENTL